MARAATSPELTYYRTPGKWSDVQAAILLPPIVYRARINQTFATLDQVLVIVYDTGSGTLGNVLPDMEVWIGSSLDNWDKGICRLRDRDATHFYLSETSEISFADNDYVTIVAAFGVWARPPRITVGGTIYMDETLYSDQHTNFDPQPNMGCHQIVEMTGASITTNWNASTSFCPNSSISTYGWSCATASASSGTTTATPTFTFNTFGWHIVYLTVTGANSKSFFGVRYVFVWDSAHPPYKCVMNSLSGDVETGGWKASITIFSNAGFSAIYERAMVVIFSKDHYGADQVNIGAVAGSENVRLVGWISSEDNRLSSEQGSLTLSIDGAAYWMGLIPSWPDGVELSTASTGWTNMAGMTVDLGVYHFLRWRTTLTRVCDITLSGDARLTNNVSSSSQNLWGQLQEMTWAQIYARPGFNMQGQLSLQIHPSLIPTGSRTAPTVMTITKADIRDDIDIPRKVSANTALLDMSGLIVTAPNTAAAKFAISPGHSLPHYGRWDIQSNLLLSSQAQVITLAGLYRSWSNNPFPEVSLTFAAPIALIDVFPNQKCSITISSSDNIRGWGYSGGLIPLSINYNFEPDSGYMYIDVTFEAETSESSSMQGDTPGSTNTDHPPSPTFPPIPIPPIGIPGIPNPTNGGPKRVLFYDTSVGFVYTDNFNAATPTYVTVNNGLSFVPFSFGSLNGVPVRLMLQQFFVTSNGAVYAWQAFAITQGTFSTGNRWFGLWYSPSIGGTFVPIFDWTTVNSSIGPPGFGENARGLYTVGYNPTASEQVMYITHELADEANIYLGGALTFAKTYTGTYSSLSAGAGSGAGGGLNFAKNKWLLTGYNRYKIINASGVLISNPGLSSITLSASGYYSSTVPAGSTGITYHPGKDPFTNNILRGTDMLTASAWLDPPSSSWEGLACDPSGNYLVGRQQGGKGKSTDAGATWVAMASLPAGTWSFAYGGPGTSLPRFIAMSGTQLVFSEDLFNTYTNKMSSSWYPSITGSPNPVAAQVLEY